MSGPENPGRARFALWAAFSLCACAIFWTANGIAPWDGDRSNAWHQYEYLTEGFLHGHTYLSVEPAPELLKLKDPYDPAANAPYRLWDTSLYNGKFYLYQGPTPVVVLMLPWRIVTGHMLPQRLAVGAFAAMGLAGLSLLFWEIHRRHFPGLSPLALGAVVIVAFHASWLPVTLRRSALWELPVVAAAACLWWSLYFLWRYHSSGGKVRWAAATAAALVLLIGSRAAALFGAGAIGLLLFLPTAAAARVNRHRWRGPLVAAALACAGGFALLLYNRERFGSWSEFGLKYVLFGEDYRSIRYSSIGFIPFNMGTYLLGAPQLSPYFPFLHPFWTQERPRGFVGFEEVYGVLYMMPVHVAALAALAWAWSNRAAAGARAAAVTLAGALGASGFAALVLFSWAWACSRFMTELMAGWTVATAVGLMVVLNARHARAVRGLAAALACWSVAAVWLASADFRSFMSQTNPRTYAAFAHALDYPSFWWARSHGVSYGQIDATIRVPASPRPSLTVLLASGRPQNVNRLELLRPAAGGPRLVFDQNEHTVLETPPLPLIGNALYVRLDAPWLYPPPQSPYWDTIEDPATRLDHQTLFYIYWQGGSARTNSTRLSDPVAFQPAVLGPPGDGTGSPWVEALNTP